MKKIKKSIMIGLFFSGILFCAEANPMKMRMYSQIIEIRFKNENDAKNAELSFADLPDNKEWAFSARWDDNKSKNLKMHDLMEKYGYRGTFYLYSNYATADGNGKFLLSHKAKNHGADYAKKLIKNGFSIGGHSMTHPPFSQLTKNELFYEIAAIKVERETDADLPLVSFAFPGGNFRNKFDPKAQLDIGRALMRCDFHHNTYRSFINPKKGISPNAFSSVCNLVPGDRDSNCSKFDTQLACLLKNKKMRMDNPNITLGIHVWHTETGWKNLETSLKKHANNPNWLYCNQNEYAAYRYQLKHSLLEKVSQNGNKVCYKLTRPNAGDLGDNVALTINVKNATPVSAFTYGKKLALLNNSFNVPHNDREKIPTVIDAMNNSSNLEGPPEGLSSRKLPGLAFFLSFNKKKNSLELFCKNKSNKDITGLYITFRLPLLYKNGIIKMHYPNIKAGKAKTIDLPLNEEESLPEYKDGKRYFLAQADFLHDNKICRFYATAREEKDHQDLRNCPRDTAMVSAPVMKSSLNLKAIRELSNPAVKLADSKILSWRNPDEKTRFKYGEKYISIRPKGVENRKKCEGDYYIVIFEDLKINKDNTCYYVPGRKAPDYVFLNGENSNFSHAPD